MNRHFGLVTALAAVAAAPVLFAVETKSWTHNSQQEFEKGTLKGLSMRSDGRLTLAPVFRELADPSIAYLWALAVDSTGTVYAGGGGPGASTARLIAIDAAGKTRTVADLPGLQIQALAVDSKDRLYAATMPDGKVFRVSPDGKHDVFYEPKTKYIWAMAFNSKGELFVATGDGGEIHRVGADGKGSVFFKTEETHARSLAIDINDNVIVGTEPGGLVIRVSPAGEGFVLYQSGKREVTAVAVSRAGVIFASAAGTKSPATSGPTSLSVPIPTVAPQASAAGTPPGPRAPTVVPAVPVIPAPSTPPASISGGSEVYRIGTDNYPQRVWSHPQDVVYSIAFDPSGRAVLGTGNKGNIHRIDSELVSTLMINASPTQVTALTTGPKGRLFAATGNVGKVFQIGPEVEKQGTYESEPMDVGYFSYWGSVRYKAENNGGGVRFETRSGNLDRPHKNWSSWAAVDSTTSRVTSPPARFLQYRVTLESSPAGQSPDLREIEIAYMAKNVAPVIEEIEITPANYRFNTPPAVSSTSTQSITLPALAPGRRQAATPAVKLDSGSSSQTVLYSKGSAGARWAVSDANGDELVFKVEIRGVQEREWKLLKDKVVEKHLSWDSTAYPDGEYLLRVTASDSPDNPPDKALSTQLESDRFVIDNTPPEMSGLTGSRTGGKLTIKWRARDARSVIRKAEYSLDGAEWVVVEPSTRLSDAPELDYAVSAEHAGSEATVAVRVTDEYENQAVAKVVVR
jgi:sugar lactone lactonase YvrE